MSTITYSEICENAKLARENALLGKYDSALVYYQGLLQQIQKILITSKEPDMKQKWQVVSNISYVSDVFLTLFV